MFVSVLQRGLQSLQLQLQDRGEEQNDQQRWDMLDTNTFNLKKQNITPNTSPRTAGFITNKHYKKTTTITNLPEQFLHVENQRQ